MADLVIVRGDDYTGVRRLTVLVTDPGSTPTANAPVDLTGVTLAFMVKRRPTDPDDEALLSKTMASGITLSNQTTNTGEALIAIDAEDTEDGPVGNFYWELQGVDAVGTITLASGRIKIAADMIRA